MTMNTTIGELIKLLIEQTGYELDNDGQLLIYSGMYEHNDGTLHEEPEGDNA